MSTTSSQTGTGRGTRPVHPSGGVAGARAVGANGALAWVLRIFAVLALLAMAGIGLFIPFWYARLAGTEARGTIYYVRDCGTDDSGDETYQDTLVFRDAEGQMRETTSGSDCVSDFSNGQRLTLWYLPGLPGDARLGGPAINFYLFSALYLVVVVACLILFFLMTRMLNRRMPADRSIWAPVAGRDGAAGAARADPGGRPHRAAARGAERRWADTQFPHGGDGFSGGTLGDPCGGRAGGANR